jgi:gliding motility-associated-like protein
VTAASSITGSSQTATVTYTHTTGCEATATFTVYAAPTITGPNGQVTNFDLCVGESLQLTGSGTPATTSPWVSNDASVSINSSTGEITANSAGSATITYTDINGGTSNITVNSYAIPVSPVIEHSSVSTAMHTICDGNETIMQVDGVIPYNINYVWEYSTTSAFASSSTVTLGNTIGSFVEEGVEGFYRAKAVSSVTNCSSGYSNILEIQTYSLSNAPSLAFSGSFNGSSTAIICDGQTVSLQASRNNGLATTQLVWEYRQTTTGVWDTIQQGINTSFTASQTGYYRVVEYSSGCSISSPYPPQSELYVNAISTSTVTLAMNGTPEYCVGDLLTFGTTGGYDYHSLNGQTPANGFTREWYIEKNNVATKITGNSYQVALSDNGSEIYFTDTYYDNAGNALCSSTTANPETITVNSLPTAPVVIFNDATNGVKTICDASSLTLKLNGNVTSIGNNTLNWEYSPDGNWNSSTTTSAPYISKTTTTIVVDSAGYYRAWFVNENNCNSVSSNVLEIQKVSLSSAPSLTITGTTSLLDTICSGGSATITATSTSASGITGSNFIWERSDDNGNSWATLSETSNSLSTGLEGWYRVTETNTSCSGQSATNNLGPTSNPFVGNTAAYINVVSPPAISLTAPSTGLDFCEGEVLTFTNNSSTFSATPKASGFTRTWYLQEQGAASPTQITTNTLVLTSNHDDAYLYIKDEHPAGCSITSSTTGIQISVKSAPSSVSIEFTDFTSSSATICSGTSTNIEVVNGSNLYTNNNATFIWEFDTDPSFATPTVNGNEFVATSNAWIKTIDEPGYYRVWIEQNGCQSLLASDDLELDTFNLPSPLITSNSPICDNSPIILTAASTYTGTLAVSFDWYKKQDDGSFSLFRTTSADTIHIYPSNSVYADESNFAVGISTTTNSGCSPSSISTPTLVDIEIPSSFTISTSKQYYCDEEYAIGSYFAASNNSINAPTDYTRTWEYYNPKTNQWAPLDLTGQGTQWLLSDLSNNTNTNVDIDIRAKDTYSGTGNLGCSTTSNTITVTVRPKPTPPVLTFSDGTNGAKTICVVSNTPVDPIGALATTTSVSGISQLIWEYSPDNTWGALTNAQASMVSALNASAANFSLDIGLLPGYYRAKSISSSTGCISTVSNTLQVLHETMSAPTITASATQVCQGTSVTLTAASTHSQAASFTYYWYKGSDTSAFTTSTTPSITISETGALSNVYSTGSFRVKTSLVGCGVSPKSGPQAITIIQPATLTVVPSSGITTFCEGDNITFGEPSSGENFEVSRVGQPANQLSTPTWWYIKDLPNATHTQISGNAISAITSDFDGAIIYVKDTYTGLSCSTTSPYNGVNAVTIAVNDAPLAPSITLAGNLASVTTECLADGIEILVTNNHDDELWYLAPGSINATKESAPISNQTNTGYLVYKAGKFFLKAVNATTGCKSGESNYVEIIESPLPTPVLSLRTETNNGIGTQYVCPGSSNPLEIEGADTSGTYFIQWQRWNAVNQVWDVLSANNQGHYSPLQSTQYRVALKESQSSACTQLSNSVDIAIQNVPAPVISLPSYGVCNVNEIDFKVSNPQLNASYIWTSDDPTVSTVTRTYSSTGQWSGYTINSKTVAGVANSDDIEFSVSVVVNGCTVPTAQSETVTIHGTPSAPSILGSNGELSGVESCTAITLEVANPNSTDLEYDWYRLDKSVSQSGISVNYPLYSDEESISAQPLNLSGYNYYVTARSDYGCRSNLSVPFELNDLDLPQVQLTWNGITGNTAYQCGSATTNYELEIANYSAYDNSVSFVLINDQGNGVDTISPTTIASAKFILTTAGNYRVRALKNTCLSDVISTSFYITTLPMPKPILTAQLESGGATTTEICENGGRFRLQLLNNMSTYNVGNLSWYYTIDVEYEGINTITSDHSVRYYNYSNWIGPMDSDDNLQFDSNGEAVKEYVVNIYPDQGRYPNASCSVSDTLAITVYQAPSAPTIENEYGTQANVYLCPGEPHTLSISSPDETNYNYNWYRGTSKVSSVPNDEYTVSGASGTYSAKTEDKTNQCVSVYSSAIAVDYADVQAPDAIITYNQSTVGYLCNGDSVVIEVQPKMLISGQSFELYLGNNPSATHLPITYDPSSVTPLQFTVTQAGYYYIKTIQGDCESSSFSNRIDIHSIPNPNLNIAGSLTACQGESISLSVPENNNWGWNYAWVETTSGATLLDTLSSSNVLNNYVPTNAAYYKVYAKSSMKPGCTYSNISSLITIASKPNTPVLDFYSDTICSDEVTRTFSITNSGGTQFKWYKDGVPDYTDGNNYHFVDKGGTWNVTAYNQNTGCESQKSLDINIYEKYIPTPKLTPIGFSNWATKLDTVKICSGSPITLSITDTMTGVTYALEKWNNWNGGGSNLSWFGSSDPNIVDDRFNPVSPIEQISAGPGVNPVLVIRSGAGVYRVRATMPGCSRVWSSDYIIVDESITGSTPVIDYDLGYTGISGICEGENVNYSIVSTIPNDVDIQWINKNEPNTVLSLSSTYSATETGIFVAKFVKDGCIKESNSFTLTVTPRPVTPILNYAGDNAIYPNQSIVIQATPAQNIYDYQWFFNSIPGPWVQGDYDDTATTAGDYAVIIRDDLGCISDTSRAAEFTNRALLEPQFLLKPVDTVMAAQSIPITQNATISICSNGVSDLTVVGPEMGKRYTLWEIPTVNMPSQKALKANGDVFDFVYSGSNKTFYSVPPSKYYIEVDDPSISGSAVQSDTIEIIGVNLLQPQITASGLDLCANEPNSVTLSVTSSSSDPSGTFYEWYFGELGELPDSMFTSGVNTVTSIGQGSYRVSKTYQGCTKYSEPIDTILAFPKPETPTISFTNDTVCLGSSSTVTISNSQLDRSYKYIVNGVAGNWTTNTTIDIENEGSWLPASGPMLAPFKRLQVINRNDNTGCIGDTSQLQVFVLRSLSTPLIDVSNGLTVDQSGVETHEVCVGEEFTIYAPNSAGSGLTYTLYKDDNLSGYSVVNHPVSGDPYIVIADGLNDATFTGITVDNNVTNYDDFKIEVSDPSAGCTVEFSSILRVKERTIVPPVATIGTGSTNTICDGDSTLIEIPSLLTTQSVEWYYISGGEIHETLDSDGGTSHYAQHSGVYYARINEGNCEISSNGVAIVATQRPTTPSLNNLTEEPVKVTLCSGAIDTITDFINTNGTYQWYRDVFDGNGMQPIATSPDSAYQIYTNVGGKYRAKRNVNGCWSLLSNPVTLEYKPLDQPEIRPLQANFNWTGYAADGSWVGIWDGLCPGDLATIIVNSTMEVGVEYALQEEVLTNTWQNIPGKIFTYNPSLPESDTRFNGLLPGKYRVRATKSNQGCDPMYSEVLQILRDTIIQPVLTPNSIELCPGEERVIIVENHTNVTSYPTGITYSYYRMSNQATVEDTKVFTDETDENDGYRVSQAGTYYVKASYGTNYPGCTVRSANDVVVTVGTNPATPILVNQSDPIWKCVDDAATITIASPAPLVDYYWYDLDNNVLKFQTNYTTPPSAQVQFATEGNYGVIGKSIGGCSSDTNKFEIRDNSVIAPIVAPSYVDLCPGETDTLRVTNIDPTLGYQFYWKRYPLTGNGPVTIMDTTRSLAINLPGIYKAIAFKSEQNANGWVTCESDESSPITVSLLSAPLAPVVTNPFICYDDYEHDLAQHTNANTNVVDIYWYLTRSSYPDQYFEDANVSHLAFNDPIKDSLWLTYRDITTGCHSPMAKMVITKIDSIPVPDVPVDPVRICNGTGAFNINDVATYDVTKYNLIKYTLDSVQLGTNEYININSDTAETQHDYYFALRNKVPVQNVICESQWVRVTFFTIPRPAKPTGGVLQYCQLDPTVDFLSRVENLNQGKTLVWYDLNQDSLNGTGSVPVISTQKDTNFYYFITSTDGECQSDKQLIQVKVNERPDANIFNVDTVYACRQDSIELAPYVNNTYSPMKLRWWESATSTDEYPNQNLKVYGELVGANLITVSKINENTGCESTRDSIWLIINANDSTPKVTTPDLTKICANTWAGTLDTFVTYNKSNFSLYWYTSDSSNTPTTFNPYYDSYSLLTPDTVSYFVSLIDANGCEGPRDKQLIVTQPLTPIAPIVHDTSYCLGATYASLRSMVAPNISYDTLYWYTSIFGQPQKEPNISQLQSSKEYWVKGVSIDGCEGPKSKISIQIEPLNSVTLTTNIAVIPYDTTTGNQGVATLTASGADSYVFYDPFDYDPLNLSVGVLGSVNPLTLSPDTSGYYKVRGSEAATGCIGVDSVLIHRNPFDPGEIGFAYLTTPNSQGLYIQDVVEVCAGQRPTDALSMTYPSGGSGSFEFKWQIKPEGTYYHPLTGAAINGDTLIHIDDSTLVFDGSVLPPSYFDRGFTVSRWAYDQAAFAISNEIRVSVLLPAPQVSVFTDPLYDTIPTGHPLNFILTHGDNPDTLAYRWKVNKQLQSATDSLLNNIILPEGTNWLEGRVYRIDQFGSLKCYNYDSLKVVVTDLIPGVISSSQSVCNGDIPQKLIGTSASGGYRNYRYLWEYFDLNNNSWDTLFDSNLNPYTGEELFFDPDSLPTNTTSYRRMAYSLSVGVPSNSVVITVLPIIPPPVVSKPVVCFGNYVGPLGATPLNGYRVEWYRTKNLTTLMSNPPIPDSLDSDGELFWISQVDTLTGCRSDLDSVFFRMTIPPNPPTLSGKPPFVCKSDLNGVDLTPIIDTNTIHRINWIDKDGYTPLSNAPNPLWNGIDDTEIYYATLTDTVTGCSGDTTNILVTYLDGPEFEIITSDSDGILCDGQGVSVNLQFSSTTNTIDSIAWYSNIAGYDTLNGFSNAIYPDSTIKYNIYIEDTSGCFTKDILWLSVVEPLDTPATLVYNYCQFEQSSPVANGLNSSLTTNGQIDWFIAKERSQALDSVPVPITSIVGSDTLYYTETDTITGCASLYGKVITNVSPLPTKPVTAPIDICDNSSVLVSPTGQSTITHGILHWYEADSLTAIQDSPVFNGLTLLDSTNFLVKQQDTITGCFSEFALARVNLLEQPDLQIVSSNSTFLLCEGEEISIGISPTASLDSVTWYVQKSSPPGSPWILIGSGATVVDTPAVTSKYIAQVQTETGCTYVYEQMVTVQALPRIPSIRDYTYCQFEEDAFAISADSLDGNNSLLWFRSSGAVDTLKTLPAPSTINDGVSFRYVQQYNPITGCASPMDTAIINILKLPSAPFTQPIEVCQGSLDTAYPIALAFGTLHWYESDTLTAISGTPILTGSTLQESKSYLVRQQDTNGCYSPYSVAPVTLLAKPNIEIIAAGNSFNICQDEQISLALSSVQGIDSITWSVRWTDASGAPQFFTQGAAGGATFVHRPDTTSIYTVNIITDKGCAYSYQQLVTVQPLPKQPRINDYIYCQFEPSTVITASSLENTNYLLWNKVNGSTDTLTMLPAPSTDSIGTYYRYVQQYNPITGCISVADTSTIVIKSLPAPPISKTYWICKDTSPDTLKIEQGNYSQGYLNQLSVEWFSASGVSYDTIPTVPTADTGSTTYLVRNVDTFGCVSETIELDAVVYQVIVDSINYEDLDCFGYTDAELKVYGHSPYPVRWRYVDSSGYNSPNFASGATAFVGASYYEVIATDTAECYSTVYINNRFFSITQPDPIEITDIISSRPTCHDSNDASIEIIAIGRSPGELLYSINNGGNWKSSNYFGNLSPYTLGSTASNKVRRTFMVDVTDSLNCPVHYASSQPDSSSSRMTNIGGNTGLGAIDTAGYDPTISRGTAISSNFEGDNKLFWSSAGALSISNSMTWVTLSVPYNPVESNEIVYAKKLAGSAEAGGHQYVKLRLRESNNPSDPGRIYESRAETSLSLTQSWSSPVVMTSLPNTVSSTESALFNLNLIDDSISSGSYTIDLASWTRVELITETIQDTIHVQAKSTAGTAQLVPLIVEKYYGPKTTFKLNETSPTVLTSSNIVDDISCWGSEDGRIDISWSSTNDVYVSVDSGVTYTSATTFPNSHRFQSLDSGNYAVTIRDENNCYIYYDQNRTHKLRSPGPIVLDSILVTPNSCYDPEVNGIENDDAVIKMFAHGGIIPDNDDINYVAPQLVYSIEGGQLGSWSTQNTFASLDTGWYHLKVSNLKNTLQDPMGCVNEYMINPYYYVDQPDSLRLDSLYYIPVQCYDSVDAFVEFYASGGNNISYSLDTLNFQTGSLFENVAPAEYFPTIEDDKNCPTYYYHKAQKTYLDIRDSIEVEEPSPMFINFVTSDLQCNEVFDSSSIEVVIIGGNIDPNTSYDPNNPATYRDSLQGFVYEWSFDSTSAIQGQYGYFIDTLSWDRADSLWAGTYNLYVEDYKGCFVEGSVTLNQPDSIRLDSIYTRPVSCWDSSNAILEIYASGGNGLFYSTDSVPDTSQVVNWSFTTSYYTLSQGDTSYVYLRDTLNQDCFVDYKADRFHFAEVLDTFTVDTAIVTPVLCFGDTTGTILVQTSGGLNPLFNFDTLSTTFDTIGFISVPSDSVYITVTDINGCTPKDTLAYTAISRKLFVPQPDPLVVLAATDSNVFCGEDTTGIISAFVAGGTTPYDILWTSGDTTLADSSVSAGLYYIEVIDTNGCYAWDSTSVFAIDSDCDLIADSIETFVDYDLDGLPNANDLDSDNDGLPDALEWDYNRDGVGGDDCDGDGWPNYLDPDICEFYVPSVITPNSDGDNDALFIPGLQYFNNYKFTVFNSMGNKVYQVENSNINFNGSTSGTVVWSTNGSLPSGTYYYVLEIRPNKWTQTGYIFLAR